jgi:integrase
MVGAVGELHAVPVFGGPRRPGGAGQRGAHVAKLVDRVAGEAGEMRTLTERDMFAILDHECRDQHLWVLALYGLRRGEIAGLRWANVDLKANTITVSENGVAVGKEIMTGTPKSKASTRTLPMPDEVVEVLRAARKRQAEERLAFGGGYGSGDYVASDETGHSCATLMHLRGVPIAVIAALAGARECRVHAVEVKSRGQSRFVPLPVLLRYGVGTA